MPYVAILTTSIFGTLAYMTLGSSAGIAFGYLATLGSAGGLLMWWSVCLIYIRFERGLREQGVDRSSLPYSSPFNKGAFAAKFACSLITIVLL